MAAPVAQAAPLAAGAAAEPAEHSTETQEPVVPPAAGIGVAPLDTAAAAEHTARAAAAAAAAGTGWAQVPAVGRQAGPAVPADIGTGWAAAAAVAAAAAAAASAAAASRPAAAAAPAGRDSGRSSPCRLWYRLRETDRW